MFVQLLYDSLLGVLVFDCVARSNDDVMILASSGFPLHLRLSAALAVASCRIRVGPTVDVVCSLVL